MATLMKHYEKRWDGLPEEVNRLLGASQGTLSKWVNGRFS